MAENKLETIVSWAKRRGFIYPASEIYGGVSGVYDWGPLGVELKNNLKAAWWQEMVQKRADVVGLDSAILQSRAVWQASGHEKGFSDPLVECTMCHKRFRYDEIANPKSEIRNPKQIQNSKSEILNCPECEGPITPPRQFNLMLKTFLGPVEDSATQTYLRPETAQGIFINFKNILQSSRQKIPFGVAQIGKAFRNEITPGNFIFRTREFEQMELEWFCSPQEAEKWYKYWVKERYNWYLSLGLSKSNLRLRSHAKEELAHYSVATTDIEYQFPWGWAELEGIANRQNYDLQAHSQGSGKDLTYFDEGSEKPYLAFVIEPSGGIDRATLALLVDAFELVEGGRTTTTESSKEEEIVLKIAQRLAPVSVAVFPLAKKAKLPELATIIYSELRKYFAVEYDEVGSVGRRYRRQDEIGTPFCVTVDFESLEDKKVTLRDRDTMKQERVAIQKLREYIAEKLSG